MADYTVSYKKRDKGRTGWDTGTMPSYKKESAADAIDEVVAKIGTRPTVEEVVGVSATKLRD